MSQMILYYAALENVSKNAENAGKKLDDYADKAKRKVASKISSYSGEHTGNINSAQDNINKKMVQLNQKSAAFAKYAEDVKCFLTSAQDTDKKVENNVKKLSGAFKSSYGITDNVITKIFNWISDKLNESDLGRFFKDMAQAVVKIMERAKDCISDWYKDVGCKYIVDIILAVGGIVLAVAGVIVTVVSGGALIFVIAGVVAGVFSVVNAITDIRNSIIAIQKTRGGDPVWAKRYGDMNTFTDTLRKENNLQWVHDTANVLDAVEFVAGAIETVGNIKELYEKGAVLFTDAKNQVNSYGGLKNYVRHQYGTFTGGVGTAKDALFASGSLKKNAADLVKISAKDTLKSWGSEFKQIVTNKTVSITSDSFSNSFMELFGGNEHFSGFTEFLKNNDRGYKNIAFVLDSGKDFAENIGKYGPFAFINGGIAGDALIDVNSITDDIKKRIGNGKNLIQNGTDTGSIKSSAQMRKLLIQRMNAAAGGAY